MAIYLIYLSGLPRYISWLIEPVKVDIRFMILFNHSVFLKKLQYLGILQDEVICVHVELIFY